MSTLGGSAALEGVMMKAPEAWALAVRLPDGSIHVEQHPEQALQLRYPWTRWPLLRGVVALWEALTISYRALNRSTELIEGNTAPRGLYYVSLSIALLLALLIFIVLPAIAAGYLIAPGAHPILYNLLNGLLKAILLVGYLLLIGKLPEMRRFFRYHGAEHKTIAAYEEGLELTVDNVRPQPIYHPRCGTTFVAFVILASIVLYSFLPHQQSLAWRLTGHLLTLPLVGALAFELLRFSSTHHDPVSRFLKNLGYRFQMLTVLEPDDEMIEVAIASTQAALRKDSVAVA